MNQLATLTRTELLEAVGDYLAKRFGTVRIHNVTVSADPINQAISVEYTPHEDEPIGVALNPLEKLP